MYALTQISLNIINNYCPNLQFLTLPRGLLLVETTSSSYTKLKRIHRSLLNPIEEIVPGTFHFKNTSLERLTIPGCRQLLHLVIDSQRLSYLSVESCLALQTISLQTKDLEYFNGKDCKQLNQTALRELSKSPLLQVILLTGSRLTEGVKNPLLVNLCPRLLLFTQNPPLTQEHTQFFKQLMEDALVKKEIEEDWSGPKLEMLAEALRMGKKCEELSLTHKGAYQPASKGCIHLCEVIKNHPLFIHFVFIALLLMNLLFKHSLR